jgi:hypothetical protein
MVIPSGFATCTHGGKGEKAPADPRLSPANSLG